MDSTFSCWMSITRVVRFLFVASRVYGWPNNKYTLRKMKELFSFAIFSASLLWLTFADRADTSFVWENYEKVPSQLQKQRFTKFDMSPFSRTMVMSDWAIFQRSIYGKEKCICQNERVDLSIAGSEQRVGKHSGAEVRWGHAPGPPVGMCRETGALPPVPRNLNPIYGLPLECITRPTLSFDDTVVLPCRADEPNNFICFLINPCFGEVIRWRGDGRISRLLDVSERPETAWTRLIAANLLQKGHASIL